MYPFNPATPIPKIQFAFKKTASNSGEDAEKLAAIKAATKHSWSGYAAKAMGHDEVKPVSGEFANPFNAWGCNSD
ncbi:hypothetical protein MRB53_037278 [Persea americana]|nr:hypothetical protein MRB53_037278 [Persea americana]